MSQTAFDPANLTAEMAELFEKQLKIANLQADTTLKQLQARYLPWQVVVASITSGAAASGALIALGHWL